MNVQTLTIPVTGMNCNGCMESVKRSLAKLEGVSEVAVSLQPGEAVVTFDASRLTQADLYGSVVAAGYGVPGTAATHGCD